MFNIDHYILMFICVMTVIKILFFYYIGYKRLFMYADMFWKCDLCANINALLFPLLIMWYHSVENIPVYTVVSKLIFFFPIMYASLQPILKHVDLERLLSTKLVLSSTAIFAWLFVLIYSLYEIIYLRI